jgi:hypothetical protein
MPTRSKYGFQSASVLAIRWKAIHIWLDRHKIQPAAFNTAADAKGYALSIAFHDEHEAARFRQQFRVIEGERALAPVEPE